MHSQQSLRSAFTFAQSDPCIHCLFEEGVDTWLLKEPQGKLDQTVHICKLLPHMQSCRFCSVPASLLFSGIYDSCYAVKVITLLSKQRRLKHDCTFTQSYHTQLYLLWLTMMSKTNSTDTYAPNGTDNMRYRMKYFMQVVAHKVHTPPEQLEQSCLCP